MRKPRPSRFACGRHAVAAALKNGSLLELWAIEGAADELVNAVRAKGLPTHYCKRARLAALAAAGKHQSVVGRVAHTRVAGWREAVAGIRDPILVAFDGIQDPRNLGACLRSAAAFGASAALRPTRRSAPLSPAATRAAAGGAEFVGLFAVANLGRELRACKDAGFFVIGAEPQAKTSLYAAELRGPLVWLFGAEEGGLRRKSRELSDLLVRIPLAANRLSSLNVSVACAICLAETQRQRSLRREE